MDIRNNLDGLKSLLGVDSTALAASRPTRNARSEESAIGNDSATLSPAASEISQAAQEDGLRADKVSSVQAALAAGTYNVSASAVAAKVIDAMLGGQK